MRKHTPVLTKAGQDYAVVYDVAVDNNVLTIRGEKKKKRNRNSINVRFVEPHRINQKTAAVN